MHSARFGVLVAVLWVAALPVLAQQSDARQRQAAAEAYDQGTAAYLSGDYEKAAEWFETANRMSPAAPALIQAARAHQQAGHQSRAATLALRIVTEYPNEAAAVQYAQGLLDQLAAKFVRVDIACDGCTIDVDGTLQESQSFFVDPDVVHVVTASFETGERKGEVSGSAGETKTIEITAPPPMPHPPTEIDRPPSVNDHEPKPLPPLATFIGAGVTAALLGTAIWSRIDTNNGVDPYKSAAMTYQGCVDDHNGDKSKCTKQYDTAKGKYDDGMSKETRTSVLWVATGVAAAATGVIALFFTDWSGNANTEKKAQARAPRLALVPTNGGAALWMKGQF